MVLEERGYMGLHYVLFDENRLLPGAFHLYKKNNKFYVDGRDERSYIVGQTKEHEKFEDTKQDFFNRLELVIQSNKLNKLLGETTEHSSPLWDNLND